MHCAQQIKCFYCNKEVGCIRDNPVCPHCHIEHNLIWVSQFNNLKDIKDRYTKHYIDATINKYKQRLLWEEYIAVKHREYVRDKKARAIKIKNLRLKVMEIKLYYGSDAKRLLKPINHELNELININKLRYLKNRAEYELTETCTHCDGKLFGHMCTKCKLRRCVDCRRNHAGECNGIDYAISKIIRRCPNCNHDVERKHSRLSVFCNNCHVIFHWDKGYVINYNSSYGRKRPPPETIQREEIPGFLTLLQSCRTVLEFSSTRNYEKYFSEIYKWYSEWKETELHDVIKSYKMMRYHTEVNGDTIVAKSTLGPAIWNWYLRYSAVEFYQTTMRDLFDYIHRVLLERLHVGDYISNGVLRTRKKCKKDVPDGTTCECGAGIYTHNVDLSCYTERVHNPMFIKTIHSAIIEINTSTVRAKSLIRDLCHMRGVCKLPTWVFVE